MKKYKTLDDFFTDQEQTKLDQVMLARKIILTAEPKLEENLKWNGPNYVYDGVDRITFNLMNREQKVKLLIHMGAKRKENKTGKPVLSEDNGIVDWQSDIRGIVSFDSIEDIVSKKEALIKLIQAWLVIAV